jgi:TadE-like protein
MPATSRASPTSSADHGADHSAADQTGDSGMVTVEAAIALCAFVTVLAMVLAGMSMVLDQIRCTDAAREAARLVARGEQDRAADAVHQIAPSGATFAVTTEGEGIVVAVRDPAAGGLLPGVHVTADAFAVPEPDADDPDDGTGAGTVDPDDGQPAVGAADPSSRSAGGAGR